MLIQPASHVDAILFLPATTSVSCHDSFMSCRSCWMPSSQFFLNRPGLLLYPSNETRAHAEMAAAQFELSLSSAGYCRDTAEN